MEIRPPQSQNILPPAMPDRNWDHTRPVPPAIPTEERLKMSSQTVKAINTHPLQTHVIYDRYLRPIEIPPQQSRECELVLEDIDYFKRERTPGRIGQTGLVRPLHPIMIESISDRVVSEDEQQATAGLAKAQEAKQQPQQQGNRR